jgi:hypothetical protein
MPERRPYAWTTRDAEVEDAEIIEDIQPVETPSKRRRNPLSKLPSKLPQRTRARATEFRHRAGPDGQAARH